MMGRNFRAPHAEDSDMVQILSLTICKAHENLEQHQVGANPKTHKLFVSGSFKHARTRGNAVATTARVNPNTLVSRRLQNDRLYWKSIFKRQGSTTSKAHMVRYSITATVMFGWAAQTLSVMVYAQDNFSPV